MECRGPVKQLLPAPARTPAGACALTLQGAGAGAGWCWCWCWCGSLVLLQAVTEDHLDVALVHAAIASPADAPRRMARGWGCLHTRGLPFLLTRESRCWYV